MAVGAPHRTRARQGRTSITRRSFIEDAFKGSHGSFPEARGHSRTVEYASLQASVRDSSARFRQGNKDRRRDSCDLYLSTLDAYRVRAQGQDLHRKFAYP